LSGPEAFDDMPADMVQLFRGCSLVICKGEHVMLVVMRFSLCDLCCSSLAAPDMCRRRRQLSTAAG
jgi:hypothetical protein